MLIGVYACNRMKGSAVSGVTLEKDKEEAKDLTKTPSVQHPHQQNTIDPSEEVATNVHDTNIISANNNLCNDFLAKINVYDDNHHNCCVDDENDEETPPMTNILCNDNKCDYITGSSATTILLIDDHKKNDSNIRFICDLGYGLPNEVRPRKEKIYAIAKQLVTFLSWQSQQQQELSQYPVAPIYIILGKTIQLPKVTTSSSSSSSSSTTNDQDESNPNENAVVVNATETTAADEQEEAKIIHETLLSRMHEVWDQLAVTDPVLPFPENSLSFCYQPLHVFLQTCDGVASQYTSDKTQMRDYDTIYLSPDAIDILDVTKPPPKNIIIGLLIDRRTIQYNRSVLRAKEHQIHAVRWPIENVTGTNGCRLPQMIHKNEPLNVDCVLEGMQQWHWNIIAQTIQPSQHDGLSDIVIGNDITNTTMVFRQSFEMAAIQAIQHHIIRHPQRPLHKTESTS